MDGSEGMRFKRVISSVGEVDDRVGLVAEDDDTLWLVSEDTELILIAE